MTQILRDPRLIQSKLGRRSKFGLCEQNEDRDYFEAFAQSDEGLYKEKREHEKGKELQDAEEKRNRNKIKSINNINNNNNNSRMVQNNTFSPYEKFGDQLPEPKHPL